MSDVKVEYEQTISRDEAAALLSQLARAFTSDHDGEFPFGPGTVRLHVPGTVRAELEIEVENDEVEVEIEFTWPLSQRYAKSTAAVAASARPASRPRPERANGAARRTTARRARTA